MPMLDNNNFGDDLKFSDSLSNLKQVASIEQVAMQYLFWHYMDFTRPQILNINNDVRKTI